jgi:hypothetical protein
MNKNDKQMLILLLSILGIFVLGLAMNMVEEAVVFLLSIAFLAIMAR